YCDGLGLREMRRIESAAGRFTLIYLAAPANPEAEIELTLNWGSDEDYGSARNFGHLAFEVDDIHATCAHLMAMGIAIHRPPRDGHMAFVRSPDLISVELLQKGAPLPPAEPWASMPNTGSW
ncbi:MAG TPA: VOC family protein, partial [Chiayiivirga sp.]|nr:VOC family protein [Chiayiivirga sp.]